MAENTQNKIGRTFFSGVLLLTISTISVKAIGLLYKIPMLSYLGAEGMGYFNSAYEIYALFCVIATAGLPVALSVLISAALAGNEKARAERIYRVALRIFFAIGFLGSLLMVLFARQFCGWIKNENAYFCMLSISPTVFLICIASALRGYFQGYQRMLPTALSQFLEAVGKLVFGLLLAGWALDQGYDTPVVAAFAGVGLTLGEVLSVLYLIAEKLRFRKRESKNQSKAADTHSQTRDILRDLTRLSVPMTFGASLVSLTKLIDMTMILRRLQTIGYSEALANEAYGSYTTLALSLYGFLPSLINSVALPLVPMLSAAIAAGNVSKQQQVVKLSYRLTAFFAIPASLGLSAFARPILSLLFANDLTAVALAAPLLSCLGASVFLSCMITATNSVLHAYRNVNKPILSMILGAAVKIVSAYFFIGNPSFALAGAPISTFLCNLTVVLLNWKFSADLCQIPSAFQLFGRPLLTSALSVGGAYGVFYLLADRLGEGTLLTLAALGLTVLLYIFLSCLMGALTYEDVLILPGGERIARALCRLRLLSARDREALSGKETDL